MKKNYDVVILGAGPAGASCALALLKSGLKVAIIDKYHFPRNKTCGDAIPGPTLKYLTEILEDSIHEFDEFEFKQRINSSVIYGSNNKSFEIKWKGKAYNSSRYSFDHFLLSLVKKHTQTAIYEGISVKDISRNENKIHLKSSNSDFSISCKLLVGCDGANSVTSKLLNPKLPFSWMKGLAISAYYKNVSASPLSNEFYFLKTLKGQGYFWIFPLPGNTFNVGLGMFAQNDLKSIDLKQCFLEAVNQHPLICQKFKNAKMTSKVIGFHLPYGGEKLKVSGEHILLAGDAAYLIDPLSGHGIDKAVKSGQLAAKHIVKCFKHNNFSGSFNMQYDEIIYNSIGKELTRNFRILKFVTKFPRLAGILHFLLTLNTSWFHKLFYKKRKSLSGE